MFKDFFYSIGWLFNEFLFLPFDILRSIQFESWYLANIVSWSFIFIGILGAAYWLKKLKEFENNNEENKDITSHSFLK
ncbi:MAG: uracil phosphoribosyltransferase [Flavobacteriaceae bacterium]|nr:uracil phosphoribosyltransferase [Flavobacteriaceae bacterium]|tara:strand:- start:221 stop:454 length:234 start_codon:yes stop_codon:yes gene_type:complete